MFESLDYPIDSNLVLRKKRSLKRNLLKIIDSNNKTTKINVAIMGGSTTAEIKDILDLFLLKMGIKASFYESNYNKYYEEVLFNNDKLENFKPDIFIIHTSFVNYCAKELSSIKTTEELDRVTEDEVRNLCAIWDKIKDKYNCPIIQNNSEMPLENTFGNLSVMHLNGVVNFVTKFNSKLISQIKIRNSIYIHDINKLSSDIGLKNWHDKLFWHSYKYALSYNVIPNYAHSLSKIIGAIFGKSKKCLILDLDNTLWGGVIGDDGLNGIQIGKETPLGESYSEFQSYIKELKSRGVLLAVCSKNDRDIAVEGFNHPDSILKVDDFVSFFTNWMPKNNNILAIAKEINIGLDSIVFIDDNPAERALVRSELPSVEVPEVGEDIAKFIEILDGGKYFEPISLSDEDLKRTEYYKDNITRVKAKDNFSNYGAYLESLEMSAQISSFQAIYLDRITQLINKTNQFNLTSRRYSFDELKKISKSKGYISIFGKLEDKFGDNGIVSVIIGNVSNHNLDIDLWIMSCRVFKREMEFAMFDKLVDISLKHKVKTITGTYIKSDRNSIVKQLYPELGFELIHKEEQKNIWNLNVNSKYKKKNKYVSIFD